MTLWLTLCDTGKVSIICALRVTDKVDITHNFYNFCSYQIDINIDDLTSTIAFAFPYFDTASYSEFNLNRSGLVSSYSIMRK